MSDSEFSADDIFFLCPHCEQEIVMEARGAGMTLQCPHCGGELVAPASSPAEVEQRQPELFDFPLTTKAVEALERSLVAVMGPLGKTLARNAAAHAESSEELMEILLSCIPNANLQERFLWMCQKEADDAAVRRDDASAASRTKAAAPAIDPAIVESAARDLAHYLGPIASIMVQRTAGKVVNAAELYERLAAQIPNGGDREKFLQSAPAGVRGIR